MRVLLIGGGGFIGRHTQQRMRLAGHEVKVVGAGDDPVPFLASSDVVVDLACETTPGVSLNAPTAELGNLSFGLRLAEALLAVPHVGLLFVSSGGTVYGNGGGEVVPETAALAPVSFHGAAKAALELFFGVLRREGRCVINVRPANAYGPGQARKSGFGFIRTVLDNVRNNREIVVWGDGETVRDFVYVTDVADAIVSLLTVTASGDYNVGSGAGSTLNQVLRLAQEVSGRDLRVRHEAARGGDVRRSVLDISALTAATGWCPTVGLEQGMRLTWAALQDCQA